MTPTQTLLHYFGYPSFRPGQLEIINSIIRKNDTLAIMPTGGGKSICFQIPGIILEGTTVVISPLISLMKDQVDTLKKKGVAATLINSSLKQTEITERLSKLKKGKYKFVYAAPERLKNKTFIEACLGINIPLIAIDEAHCISAWGHDFRPDYRLINQFIHLLKRKPIIAGFTATATPQVRGDIVKNLELKKPQVFIKSFRRENLFFNVTQCDNRFQQELSLFRLLKKHSGESGVIYSATRKTTKYLADLINHFSKQKKSTKFYHGGMNASDRGTVQEEFLADQVKVITATNAFGMGVDKPNVRFVIHYQIPGNLENYYQEAGRAGRDGKLAHCYLLFNPFDIEIQATFINQTHPDKNNPLKKYFINKLKKMIWYATSNDCRHQTILQYFDENSPNNCSECDHCIKSDKSMLTSEKIYLDRLSDLRTTLAKKYSLHPTQIMTKRIIELLALHQPQSENDYLKIPGIGFGWLDKWYNIVNNGKNSTEINHDHKQPGSTV